MQPTFTIQEPDENGGSQSTDAERKMVARARYAFTRLAGMEFGDNLADEIWADRVAKACKQHGSQ